MLKIWPSYYLFLLVMLAFETWILHGRFFQAVKLLLPDFLNYQNYTNQPIGHLWSLAVEEHFYILLPLLFILCLRYSKTRWDCLNLVVKILIATIIAVCVYRTVTLWHQAFTLLRAVQPTQIRIDGLCFGVVLAYLYNVKPDIWASLRNGRYYLLAASVIGLSPAILLHRESHYMVYTIGYTALYLGYGALLVVTVQTKLSEGLYGKFMSSKFGALISWIGTYSYTIYLWHELTAVRPMKFFESHYLVKQSSLHWIIGTIVYLLLAIIPGVIFSRLIELPTLATRDKLYPPRAESIRFSES
jgi:peptidoglycan/LPS O-acetylase OafA/YrhL